MPPFALGLQDNCDPDDDGDGVPDVNDVCQQTTLPGTYTLPLPPNGCPRRYASRHLLVNNTAISSMFSNLSFITQKH